MEEFKVKLRRGGIDEADWQLVEAEAPQAAAEQLCGERLVEGAYAGRYRARVYRVSNPKDVWDFSTRD